MIYLEFPKQEYWKETHKNAPVWGINSKLNELIKNLDLGKGIFAFTRNIEVTEFIWQIHYRITDVAKCFILMSFYYEKGISDDVGHVSPGSKGSSIEYFPNLEGEDYQIKDWFNFYSDIFYYKLFSAWDTVGHLLNVIYKLGIQTKRVSFTKAVNEFEDVENELWGNLKSIMNSDVYKKSKNIRNDITHNYLPGTTGMAISKKQNLGETKVGIGIRRHTSSKEIMENVPNILNLFHKTLDCLTSVSNSN